MNENVWQPELKVLSQDEDLNYNVELHILRSGLNENQWDFRNIVECAASFAGTPILTAYVNGKIGDGHNMRTKRNPATGATYKSFTDPTAERIVGAISDNPDDITVETIDGEEWVIAKGKLWRFYNRELVDKIAKQGSMSVSAETDIKKERKVGQVEIFEKWRGLGVTILGDNVAPAVPGANVKALAALQETFGELKLAAASKTKPKEKGVKWNMTRTQKAELQKLFADHTVVNASEDGTVVLLRSKADFSYCGYKFASKEDMGGIVPDRITEVKLMASAVMPDSMELEIDLYALMDEMQAEYVETTGKLGTLSAEVEELKTQLTTLNTKEMNRRVAEAERVASSTLETINKNRTEENQIDPAVCSTVTEAAKKGNYSSLEDADGNWVGAERVKTDVMAACMAKQLEQDEAMKVKLLEQAKQAKYPWETEGATGSTKNALDDEINKILGE